MGTALCKRNTGLADSERRALDDTVESALGLTEAEQEIVSKWARENPPPVRRKGPVSD
jgi:hypothetical protein